MNFPRASLLVLVAFLVGSPALAGRADRLVLAQALTEAGLDASAARSRAALLDEMVETISDNYVERRSTNDLAGAAAAAIRALPRPAKPEDAFKAATEAVTKALDPHTAYLTPSDMDEMRVTMSGSFSGVGMELSMKDEHVTVVAPIDDSPAARAGIVAGDRVTHVDGQPVSGLSLAQVVSRIRGPTGSSVALTVARDKEPVRVLTLRRDVIRLAAVKVRLEEGVAVVRVTQFAGGVARGVRDALKRIEQENPGAVKGVVLDLRHNPGGLLDQAVALSDLFLGDVPIVATVGRSEREVIHGRSGEIMGNLPVAVLIDQGSASASEIVAGALKDNGRAIVVGQKSFGKGSVQTILPLSEGALRVTTARYLRPNTQPVDKVGIQPDVVAEPVEGSDEQLKRALAVIKSR